MQTERHAAVGRRFPERVVDGMAERFPVLARVRTDERAHDAGELRGAADLLGGELEVLLRDDGDAEQPAVAVLDVVGEPVVVGAALDVGELDVGICLDPQHGGGVEDRLVDVVGGHVVEAGLGVVRGRTQNRAGRLTAQRDRYQARGYPSRGTATRAAGRAIVRPGVARPRRIGVRELGRDHLAQQDSPGALQARNRLGIGGRDAIRVRPEAGRSSEAKRVVDVLGAEWHTMQGRQIHPLLGGLFGNTRRGQRAFGVQADPGLDTRVELS